MNHSSRPSRDGNIGGYPPHTSDVWDGLMPEFVSLDTYDVRFPTSLELDGSDAMNPDPDYSAAYVVLRTGVPDAPEGHGFAFTIGRGNDVQTAAIAALRPYLVGRDVDAVLDDLAGSWRGRGGHAH